MARTICEAKKQGIVPRRGKPSIEFYKNGEPQYYCYGYIDSFTDEILDVCKKCKDHVDKVPDDLNDNNELIKLHLH